MNKKVKSQYGFTLLELAGVLLVSSVLAGMGIPMVKDIKNSAAGSSLQDDLALSLAEAREYAVSTGSVISVCASEDGMSCKGGAWSKGWIVYQGKRLADGEQVELVNVINSHRIENDQLEVFVFDERSHEVMDIRFNERGFNVDQNKIESKVCSSDKNLLPESVTVERSGRVRVLARLEEQAPMQTFCS